MVHWRYRLGTPAYYIFDGARKNVRKNSMVFLEKAGYVELSKKSVWSMDVLLTEKGKVYISELENENPVGDSNERTEG